RISSISARTRSSRSRRRRASAWPERSLTGDDPREVLESWREQAVGTPTAPSGGPLRLPEIWRALMSRIAAASPARPIDWLLEHPVLARIGRTPLVELQRIPRPGVSVFAKLEAANPGGSVKDRAARGIVLDAFARGWLPGRRLLDSTSGNTGIAYAMLGAALGFGVTLCLPASASPERKRILHAYGAELIETDAAEGSDGARLRARELAEARPDHVPYDDHEANPAN